MSSHVFHEVYLHLNWHTKGDRPFLSSSLEPVVHGFIKSRCAGTKGVFFHAIGGTENHVHLAVAIEPSVCISDMVGDLKGACSHEVNRSEKRKDLEWQRGFGVVSFGKQQLDWVIAYIANQKQHHREAKTRDRLERTTLEV